MQGRVPHPDRRVVAGRGYNVRVGGVGGWRGMGGWARDGGMGRVRRRTVDGVGDGQDGGDGGMEGWRGGAGDG